MTEHGLVDCLRENNIEKREYTWFKRNPVKKARLYYFLISDNLYTDITETKILPGYRTDHSLILIAIKFGKFKKGISYWKFNNSSLKEQEFINEIKQVIYETKAHFASDINSNADINAISPVSIKFTIDDQLSFETLLLNIRGKCISYSSYRKKKQIHEENHILKQIEILEKQIAINFEVLEEQKRRLLEIRKKNMEGVF